MQQDQGAEQRSKAYEQRPGWPKSEAADRPAGAMQNVDRQEFAQVPTQPSMFHAKMNSYIVIVDKSMPASKDVDIAEREMASRVGATVPVCDECFHYQ